jgi:hypothetical protein
MPSSWCAFDLAARNPSWRLNMRLASRPSHLKPLSQNRPTTSPWPRSACAARSSPPFEFFLLRHPPPTALPGLPALAPSFVRQTSFHSTRPRCAHAPSSENPTGVLPAPALATTASTLRPQHFTPDPLYALLCRRRSAILTGPCPSLRLAKHITEGPPSYPTKILAAPPRLGHPPSPHPPLLLSPLPPPRFLHCSRVRSVHYRRT